MLENQSNDGIVFGLSGIEPQNISVKDIFWSAVDCFEHFGFTPDKGVIRGGGYSGKSKFSTILKKAKELHFQDVKYMELFTEDPASKGPFPKQLMSFMFNAGDKNTEVRFSIGKPEKNRDLLSESNYAMIEKIVKAADPEYGEFRSIYGPGGFGVPGVDVDFSNIALEWSRRSFDKIWRCGYVGGVYPLNLLSHPTLSAQIEGQTLEAWIKADAKRGTLRDVTEKSAMWIVPNSVRAQIYLCLYDNGLIFVEERDGPVVDVRIAEQYAKRKNQAVAIPDHEEKLRKRNRLIAKVVAAEGTELPMIGLDEYFDGNWDHYSIAPNAADYGRPNLAKCYEILKRIRARRDVQDVLVDIQEIPDIEDSSENDRWLSSDKVLILTSCGLAAVKEWTEELGLDEVAEVSASWKPGEPPGAPELQAAMKAYSLWWD